MIKILLSIVFLLISLNVNAATLICEEKEVVGEMVFKYPYKVSYKSDADIADVDYIDEEPYVGAEGMYKMRLTEQELELVTKGQKKNKEGKTINFSYMKTISRMNGEAIHFFDFGSSVGFKEVLRGKCVKSEDRAF